MGRRNMFLAISDLGLPPWRAMRQAPIDPAIVTRAIDQTAEAVVIADTLGRIVYANPAAERLAGASSGTMRDRHFVTLLRERDAAAAFERIGAKVASGQTWSGPHVGQRADGSSLEVELVVSPVRDQSGGVTHSVAILRDVSYEREMAGTLTPDLRRQTAIGASLARLDPTEPVGALAADIAGALLVLESIDFGRIVAFGPGGSGQIIADESRGVALPTQRRVPAARARYLRQRAAQGAWVEAWTSRKEYGRYGRQVSAAGIRAVGFAPLQHQGKPVGVLAAGTLDPSGVQILESQLSALTHFGTLASGILGPALAAREHAADVRTGLERVIRERAFTTVFQAIVELRDGAPIAYEALTRFSDGTPPDRRFADADAIGLGVELETATLQAALEAARALPPNMPLSVNVSPRLVLEMTSLLELLRGSRPVVLEITEREPIEDYVLLRRAIAGLGVAVRWAVDDAGAGYASLRHIIELKPDYVKLDRGLVSGLSVDPVRQALIAGMLHFAGSIGVKLIAEGVETDAERLTLSALGVELGQGYLFDRPGPANTSSDAESASTLS
jgi:PAS domain S-box-containing protein